jgi:integrase/recombinase XerD
MATTSMTRPRSGFTLRQLRAAERRKRVWPFVDPLNPRGFVVLMREHIEALKVKGHSERTVGACEWSVSAFIVWCQERDLMRPQDVTRPILQRYQRVLFYARKEDGSPLTLATQHHRLVYIKQFFLWLTKQNYLLSNPASGIELPKVEKRLPKHVLTGTEVEKVLAQADLGMLTGVRDRAILETLYSTGVRRREVARIKLVDLDIERGTVMVRQGKGRKDRMIPIGERAMAWIEKYAREVRPGYAVEPDDGTLFLTHFGEPLSVHNLSALVARYVEASGIGKKGGCHLFRHAMATLMLEGGADIRFIQQMLGHVKLTTTEIYTQVSIKKLKEIHTMTHPAARLGPPTLAAPASEGAGEGLAAGDRERDALTAALEAEGDDEADGEGHE